MSFGCSISDVALLVKLAVKTVNGCRNACGEYAELTREVSGLNAVLQRLERETAGPSTLSDRSGSDYKEELKSIAGGCRSNLEKLDKILEKYNSLNPEIKSRTKLWKKVKFASGETVDLADMRGKITFYTSALGLYINLTTAGSVGRIEKQMNEAGGDLKHIKSAVNEITAYLMTDTRGEGSVLTAYEGDERAVWKEFRRELIRDGFSSSVLKKHKRTIQTYIQELSTRGLLDEPIASLEISEIGEPSSSAGNIEPDGKDPRDMGVASTLQLNNKTLTDCKSSESRSSIHVGPNLKMTQSNAKDESTVYFGNTCTDVINDIPPPLSIVSYGPAGLMPVEGPHTISECESTSSVRLIDMLHVECTPLDRILFKDLQNRCPLSSLEVVIAAKRVIQWLRNVRREHLDLNPDRSAQQAHQYATMNLMSHVEPILRRWQRQVQTLVTDRVLEGPGIMEHKCVILHLNMRSRRLQESMDQVAIPRSNRPFIFNRSAPTFRPTDIDRLSGQVLPGSKWPSLVEQDPTLCSIHLRPTELANVESLLRAETTTVELLLAPYHVLISRIDKSHLEDLLDATNSDLFKNYAKRLSEDPAEVEPWLTQMQSLWDLEHVEWQSQAATFREYHCLKYMVNILHGWRAAVYSTSLHRFFEDEKTQRHVLIVLLELECTRQIIQKRLNRIKRYEGNFSSNTVLFEMLGF